MKYVYAKMRRTGLCNKLFPWARAVVYAKENGVKMIAPKWTDIMRIGPWVRREKYKRYYFGDFTNEGYINNRCGLLANPLILRILGVKVFSGMEGFFDPFLAECAFVKEELRRITNPLLLARASNIGKEPFIGVHVRRGDFVRSGSQISDEWYVSAIKKSLEIVGALPVKIFSDAYADELARIVGNVGNVEIMPPAPAIQDLLSLSYARAVICTTNSTFSMWAVFLGQNLSIWPRGASVPNLYINGMSPVFV